MKPTAALMDAQAELAWTSAELEVEREDNKRLITLLEERTRERDELEKRLGLMCFLSQLISGKGA